MPSLKRTYIHTYIHIYVHTDIETVLSTMMTSLPLHTYIHACMQISKISLSNNDAIIDSYIHTHV
jgi:hypothetical protein